MTIETLKENRNEIISLITELVGSGEVKKVMTEMADSFNLKYADTEFVDIYTKHIIYMVMDYKREFTPVVEKKNIASMIADANDHKTFNHLSKSYN